MCFFCQLRKISNVSGGSLLSLSLSGFFCQIFFKKMSRESEQEHIFYFWLLKKKYLYFMWYFDNYIAYNNSLIFKKNEYILIHTQKGKDYIIA